jgi:crotonobetainyl-CoA:carnitine CoA-transferase CaiB-like acyl-CoA transferase
VTALAGIRVLELGGFISGPYAGQLLAELGADVVKVEPPNGGDPFRGFGGGDYSPQFCAYNWHKRSVVLDLSRPDGVAALRRLAARADVMLDNMRPGVLGRLGLDRAAMVAENPGLICASLTGFGATGPLSGQPAYDTVAMARSGLLCQLLDPDRPAIAGPAMADAISGLYTALGILGALVERARSGQGRRVEVAMTEAVSAFATEPFPASCRLAECPARMTGRPCRNPMRCPVRMAGRLGYTCRPRRSFGPGCWPRSSVRRWLRTRASPPGAGGSRTTRRCRRHWRRRSAPVRAMTGWSAWPRTTCRTPR